MPANTGWPVQCQLLIVLFLDTNCFSETLVFLNNCVMDTNHKQHHIVMKVKVDNGMHELHGSITSLSNEFPWHSIVFVTFTLQLIVHCQNSKHTTVAILSLHCQYVSAQNISGANNKCNTRNRKHRRAAAKPAACAKPLMLSTPGSKGKRVR